ncbi:hypothetical protein B0H19DRAFT_1058402 [Mycena capillaripes]|nr:hypothetical protein B0H19DRAFT_1058402 [Mycena capillaripes]
MLYISRFEFVVKIEVDAFSPSDSEAPRHPTPTPTPTMGTGLGSAFNFDVLPPSEAPRPLNPTQGIPGSASKFQPPSGFRLGVQLNFQVDYWHPGLGVQIPTSKWVPIPIPLSLPTLNPRSNIDPNKIIDNFPNEEEGSKNKGVSVALRVGGPVIQKKEKMLKLGVVLGGVQNGMPKIES